MSLPTPVTGRLATFLTAILPIFLAWLVTRVYLLVWLTYHPPDNADAVLYSEWAVVILNGAFPSAGNGWQYPPLYGAPIALLGLAPAHTASLLAAFGLALDAVILSVLVRARRLPEGTPLGAWAWVLGGLAVGPLLYETLDLVPTTFSVLGLFLIATNRLRASGIAIGLGLATKLWPVVLLAGWWRRDLKRTIVWVVATFVVTSLAMSVVVDRAWIFLTNQGGRGLHVESVAAYPWFLTEFIGIEQTRDDGFGSIDFVGQGPRVAGVVATLVGIAVIVFVAWKRFRGALDDVPTADVSFAVLLVLVVSSRINSPQFIEWLVAVGAFTLVSRRSRMLWPVFLVLLAALMTQGIIAFYNAFMDVQALPFIVHSLRITFLVSACVVALWQVFRRVREPVDEVAGSIRQ